MTGPSALPWPRNDILHHLMFRAAVGAVTRHDNGELWVDGGPVNEAQRWGLSVLGKRRWLAWMLLGAGHHECCLSPAGSAVLAQWDVDLFGPPDQPTASNTPLPSPPCLADDAEAQARRLLRMIFEVTPDETETR